MTDRALSYQDLLEIIRIVEASPQFAEFRLKAGDVEIELIRADHAAASGRSVSASAGDKARSQQDSPQPASAAPAVAVASPLAASTSGVGSAEKASLDVEADIAAGMLVVRSPMVGNFYRAPEPGAAPFVEAGQRIEAGAVVCIIEVMKLMNSLSADSSGVVRRVLVQDGETVEYGQPLIIIDPKG